MSTPHCSAGPEGSPHLAEFARDVRDPSKPRFDVTDGIAIAESIVDVLVIQGVFVTFLVF